MLRHPGVACVSSVERCGWPTLHASEEVLDSLTLHSWWGDLSDGWDLEMFKLGRKLQREDGTELVPSSSLILNDIFLFTKKDYIQINLSLIK